MKTSFSLLSVWCVGTFLACGGAGESKAAGPDLDESIRALRMGTLVIETAPGTEVRVEQLRHEFWFGAALANQFFHENGDPQQAAEYKQVFLD